MANSNPNKISQIQVGDITYDLVDAEARSFLNYLKNLATFNFNGAKSIGFGDSNMAGTYFDTDYESTRDQCIYGQICNMLGCEYDNYGVNGAHFETDSTKYHNTWHCIGDQIDAAEADDEVSLVVVIGGINDYHYADIDYWHFLSCVKSSLNKIINKFPYAYILLIWDQGHQEPNQEMLRYAKGFREIAKDYVAQGKTVVTPFTSDICLFDDNYYYYHNQNHFAPSGANEIAKRAIAALLNIPVTPTIKRKNISPVTGFSDCRAVIKTVIDPITFIRTDDIDIFFGSSFNYTGGDNIPQSTTILNLPFGFDGNTATVEREVYIAANPMAGSNSSSTTSFSQVGFVLSQTERNYYAYQEDLTDTAKATSPSVQLKMLYSTPKTNISSHRTTLHYHNIMTPRTG